MYAQQANTGIAPLDAVLATAQMITPDGGNTVAAQVAQAATQKMQPQGIMGGMPQARQDFRTAAEIDNMKRMQMQQAMQQMAAQMTARPAGIEELPAKNMETYAAAQGGVVGYASRGYVDPQLPEVYEDYIRSTGEERTGREEEELFGPMKTERQRAIEAAEEELLGPTTRERLAAAPPRPAPANRPSAPAPRPPAPAPRPPAAPAASTAVPQTRGPATGVAALVARPTMDLSRYEKAGAEDRSATQQIIAAQEANAAAKAAYMAGRPKFEQEGIAALTKANQAREELLAKERADDAYRRQQALLDQIGRRNLSAYRQEEDRQRQRDLMAAEAQRLYEQAVIKQREAEFLQGAGRFEEAKKALDDKEKILSAMQTRINQARQTEAGIAEREFAGMVQMYEGSQNRANAIEVERMRRATADRPGETERIFNRFNELKAKDPAAAEAYLQDIERIKGAGRGLEDKAEFARLRQQATMLQNELKEALSMDPLGKSPRVAQLRTKLDSIYQQLGGGTVGGGASNDPLGIRK